MHPKMLPVRVPSVAFWGWIPSGVFFGRGLVIDFRPSAAPPAIGKA